MQRHSTCIGWPLPTQNHNRPLLRPWIINYEANAEKLTRMHPPVGRGASRDSSPAPTSLGFPPAHVQAGDPHSFCANGSSPFIVPLTSWLGDVGVAVAGLDFEISGLEHLESVRPAVFTFNHPNYLGSVGMAHLIRHDFVAFCKQEVANNRVLGPLLRAHGTIFVDRDQADQSLCLRQAREALRNGKSLVIAPEGTRSATGELLEFKQGAFYIARRMKVPIVPVVLHNVSDALPKGKLLVRPATIQVSVLPPVWPEEARSLKHAGESLRERYRAIMRAPFNPECEPLPAGLLAGADQPVSDMRSR